MRLHWSFYPLLMFLAGVLCVPFLLCAAPFIVLPRGKREHYTWWTNAWSSMLILRVLLLARFRVRGREHIPFGTPYLVIANHRSWVDVLTLIWLARAQGISKNLVKFTPILAQLGYLGGAVFFNRNRPDARRRARQEAMHLLRNGVPLHVYPEGTRSRDGKLRDKVHLGMIEDCWDNGIPVVPCALDGTEQVIPINVLEGVGMGRTIDVRFEQPLNPRDYPDARAFSAAAWQRVTEMVLEREAGRGDGAASGRQ